MNIPNNLTTPPLWGTDAASGVRMILNKVASSQKTQNTQSEQSNQSDQNTQSTQKKKKKKKKWNFRSCLSTLTMLVGFGMTLGTAGWWAYEKFFANGSSEKESKVETLLTYNEDYERVMDDDELEKLVKKIKAPKKDDDLSPVFGTYASEVDGREITLTFDHPDSDDNRVVATFTTSVDGKKMQKGLCCYCGGSVFALYKNKKRIGRDATNYFYVKKDGEAIRLTDSKGKEKIDLTLSEDEEEENEDDEEDDDDDYDY